MPILDDILSQPAILISIGVALLLIVAAVVLAILPRIKASRTRSKRRKATATAARLNAAQEAETAEAAEEEVVPIRKPAAAQAGKLPTPSAPVVSAPVAAKAPVATPSAPVVSGGPAAAASALTAALTGGTPEAKKEEEVSPEMQDLLSSVFSDEDNSERQAILLKGIEPVSIDELLILSKAVAAQLRGEQPSNIVRVKENQLS